MQYVNNKGHWEWCEMVYKNSVQAYFKDISGLFLDHSSKMNIAIKQLLQ